MPKFNRFNIWNLCEITEGPPPLTSFFVRNSLISESLEIDILLLILAIEDSRGGKGDGYFPFCLVKAASVVQFDFPPCA